MIHRADSKRIPGYCGLCIARCGTVATVEDGRFIRLDPDPSHPTGQALCAKGRAAPELVYHPERLTRISHTAECIEAANQRKPLFCNHFRRLAERAHADRVSPGFVWICTR